MKPPKKRIIRKKKAIRDMRKGEYYIDDGYTVSHKMAWAGDPSKRRGNFGVFPTVRPKEGKEKSHIKSDWETQSAQQATENDEMIYVKRRKRAEKLAAGSWKKGIDKKEAMKSYRNRKKK